MGSLLVAPGMCWWDWLLRGSLFRWAAFCNLVVPGPSPGMGVAPGMCWWGWLLWGASLLVYELPLVMGSPLGSACSCDGLPPGMESLRGWARSPDGLASGNVTIISLSLRTNFFYNSFPVSRKTFSKVGNTLKPPGKFLPRFKKYCF